MPPKNDVPLDPKEAKRLAKLEAEEKKRQLKEKIEQQKVKDAELEVLRAKVKKMLLYRQPPSPLEYVASVVPKFMSNPWLFVHDMQLTNKFLDEAASVLKEYGHITPDVLKPVEADAKALLAQYQKKEEQQLAAAAAIGRVASPEPKEKDAITAAAEDDLESRMSAEEKERRKQAQLLLMHEGLRDLSEFAIGQPAFFITDISILKRLVRTLQMLMDNEKVFSRLLSLLSPTMKNTALHPLIAEAKLIPPLMEFIMRHMPETSEDPEVLDARDRAVVRPKTSAAESSEEQPASEDAGAQEKASAEQSAPQGDQSAEKNASAPGEPAAVSEEDSNGKPLRHTYSMETFQAVFNAIRLLSVSSQLRSIFKEDGERYLHLRGMVSGVYKGFNTVQKTFAFRSLQNIVEDSLSEQNISRGNTPAECNAVMLQYWRGHVHELFCDKIAVDPGNVFGGAGRKRLLKSGFADQASLDALNKKNLKRK